MGTEQYMYLSSAISVKIKSDKIEMSTNENDKYIRLFDRKLNINKLLSICHNI